MRKNIQVNYEIFERINTYDKVLKMIESSEKLDHLTACRNYFNQFDQFYYVSLVKKEEFERKFEAKKQKLIAEELKQKIRKRNE